MLTELYIEALLIDEELADLVWEAMGWWTHSRRPGCNCLAVNVKKLVRADGHSIIQYYSRYE